MFLTRQSYFGLLVLIGLCTCSISSPMQGMMPDSMHRRPTSYGSCNQEPPKTVAPWSLSAAFTRLALACIPCCWHRHKPHQQKDTDWQKMVDLNSVDCTNDRVFALLSSPSAGKIPHIRPIFS